MKRTLFFINKTIKTGLEILHSAHIEGLHGTIIDVVNNIDTIRYTDTILGVVCMVILLLMRVSPYK